MSPDGSDLMGRRRLAWFRPAPLIVWMPALVVLLPVLVVVWRGLQPAGEIWPQIMEARLWGHLWQSLVLAGAVTLLAIVFGVPAAWQVTVHDFPGRRLLEWALLLPLAMPGFVAAMAYVDGLERLIPVYVRVRTTFGVETFLRVQEVVPWVFAIGVLASTLFPYVYLSCRAVFEREAAGALEAARTLGAGRARVFLRVAVPMARPAIAAGGSLVAMEALNDYGVVSAFGLTPLTPGIFRVWTEGHPEAAMRLALMLTTLMLLLLGLERWERGSRGFASDPGETPLARRRLGVAGTVLAWGVCAVPLLLGFLLPAWRMTRWAWQARERTDWTGMTTAAGHALLLASAAAVLITLGALVLVAGKRVVAGNSLRTAQRIGLLGYALPGAMVAVGIGALVSALAARPGFGFLALSASTAGLMAAYFVRFLAVSLQPVTAGFERLSSTLHEAARTLGATPARALAHIDLPLVWPAVLAGATLAFIDVFKELPMTLVLRPFDFETLATETYRLTGEARIPEAAGPGLLMVAISLIGLIPLSHLIRRRLQ
jgi:iron(III) transport system permease protein